MLVDVFKAKLARLKDQVPVVLGAAAMAAPAVVAAAAAYRPEVPMTGREQAWQDYGQPAYQPGGAAAMAAPAAAAERNIKKRGRTTFNDDVVWLVNAGASEKNFVIHEIDGRVNLCLPADGAAMLVYDGRGLNKSNLKQFLNEYLQDYLKGFSVWNKHLNRFMTYQELKSYILSCLSTVIDIDQATLRSFLE